MELKEVRRIVNNIAYISLMSTETKDKKKKSMMNEYYTALNKATDCIDKQIPLELIDGKCLRCGRNFNSSEENFQYCPECGQKINCNNQ